MHTKYTYSSHKESDSSRSAPARRKSRSSQSLRQEPLRDKTANVDQTEGEATARIRELEVQIRRAEAKLQRTEARLRDAQPAPPPSQPDKTDVSFPPKRLRRNNGRDSGANWCWRV
ncbi:hypothetical protein K438DRAFT_1772779 [Mycena galopus ATCC 62051]|nr:hypothetical protein K438DRAFT_1772779 [Mycena galopus ATCC 62051]